MGDCWSGILHTPNNPRLVWTIYIDQCELGKYFIYIHQTHGFSASTERVQTLNLLSPSAFILIFDLNIHQAPGGR